MPMFITYSAKHYSDAYAKGSSVHDCSKATTPFNANQWAYASRNTDALKIRNIEDEVSVAT